MTEEEKRRKRNEDLIRRVKNGEPTAMIDAAATWWPPRSKIEKDKKEVEKLFGVEDER